MRSHLSTRSIRLQLPTQIKCLEAATINITCTAFGPLAAFLHERIIYDVNSRQHPQRRELRPDRLLRNKLMLSQELATLRIVRATLESVKQLVVAIHEDVGTAAKNCKDMTGMLCDFQRVLCCAKFNRATQALGLGD